GDDELYRKAIGLGFDRDDVIVRGILVRQMRLLLKRAPNEAVPDDAELRAYLDRHRDGYVEPARVTFRHVFLAADRRGSAVDTDARALLARLGSDATPPLGDPFPPGSRVRSQSEQDLTRVLGAD